MVRRHATPEEAAVAPDADYWRRVLATTHASSGTEAIVHLAAGDRGSVHALCLRAPDGWTATGSSGSEVGESAHACVWISVTAAWEELNDTETDDEANLGAAVLYAPAPRGARAALIAWKDQTVQVPVQSGWAFFVAWDFAQGEQNWPSLTDWL